MDNLVKHICYWKRLNNITIIARRTEAEMIRTQIIYAERYYKVSSLIYLASNKRREKILLKRLPWLLHKKKRLDKLVKLNDKYTRLLNQVVA